MDYKKVFELFKKLQLEGYNFIQSINMTETEFNTYLSNELIDRMLTDIELSEV